MSFSLNFAARSRNHALRLLEQRAAQLPTPVLSFIKASLENLAPPKDAQRTILVEASGHLCDSDGSFAISNATIKVTPIDIPD
jgi:hypothetical protein